MINNYIESQVTFYRCPVGLICCIMQRVFYTLCGAVVYLWAADQQTLTSLALYLYADHVALRLPKFSLEKLLYCIVLVRKRIKMHQLLQKIQHFQRRSTQTSPLLWRGHPSSLYLFTSVVLIHASAEESVCKSADRAALTVY